MTYTDPLTLGLALYATALSTYEAISRYRERRRRVTVELAWGFGLAGGVPSGGVLLAMSASNPGDRDVVLSSAGFALPNRRSVVLLRTNGLTLPFRLAEGSSCGIWFDPHELAVNLKREGLSGEVRLGGYFKDAVGKVYHSNRIHFDIDANAPS